MSIVENALRLVAIHQGKQVDKGGNPYILHLIKVALQLDTEQQRCAALLHDIIEDTDCNYVDLVNAGIPMEVIEIVKIVTRKKDESYMDFIKRIKNSNNDDAKKIKLLDIIDNMDLTRLDEITHDDLKRCEKYRKAFKVLSSK